MTCGAALAAPPGVQVRTSRSDVAVTVERNLSDGKALVSVFDAREEPVLGLTEKDFSVHAVRRPGKGHPGHPGLQEPGRPPPRRAGPGQLVLDGRAGRRQAAARGRRRDAEERPPRRRRPDRRLQRDEDREHGRPRPARGGLQVEQDRRARGVRREGLQQGGHDPEDVPLRGHVRRRRAHQADARRRPAVPRGLLGRRRHQQRPQGRLREPGGQGARELPRRS